MASSIPLADRADCLRAHFDAAGVDAYFIPSEDAHNSEYVRPVDERRAFVSGFNGSAGTGARGAARRPAVAGGGDPHRPGPAPRPQPS